jgi:flagellar FliL protein
MPAIRNAILMILANKTSKELLYREGKELLAQEILREAVRPMGIEVSTPEPVTPAPTESASAAASSAAASASKPKGATRHGRAAQPDRARALRELHHPVTQR